MRLLRRALRIGFLSGVGFGVWRTVRSRRAAAPWSAGSWVSPNGSGSRPPSVPTQPPRPVAAATTTTPTPARAPTTPSPAPSPSPASGTTPASSPPSPATAPQAAWVAALDGACPVSHPVKAKLSSGIFHLPGGRNYDRTRADRCYRDGPAAEADGLRRSKA